MEVSFWLAKPGLQDPERDWAQETTAFLPRTYPELAEGNKPLSVQIQWDQRL
jgi:hypothetical protein